MHAGRVRLRPIVMTTFALIAGMMPVAIGVGEGGEFYRPMAVAIIGGTLTSTLLTLLLIPSIYDSIEINRERLKLKNAARALLWNPFLAYVVTRAERIATLLGLRFLYRVVRLVLGFDSPVEHPVERAARLKGFVIPAGWVARPKPWQRGRRTERPIVPPKQPLPEALRTNPYAAQARTAD